MSPFPAAASVSVSPTITRACAPGPAPRGIAADPPVIETVKGNAGDRDRNALGRGPVVPAYWPAYWPA